VIALLKKGDDVLGPVRPIGMGETLEKVCAILLKERAKPELPRVFEDHNQMAFTPFGAEASTHAVQVCIDLHPEDDNFKGDGENAYGLVSRAECYDGLKQDLPHLLPHFLANYHHVNNLWYRKDDGIERIEAAEGGVQGHTLMSLYFAMGARKPFRAMKQCLPNGLFECFADDNLSSGPTEEVQNAIRALQATGPTAGVRLNPRKSVLMIGRKASLDEAKAAALHYTDILGAEPTILFHPDNYDDPEERAHAADLYGMEHLGVPVGTIQFINAWLSKRIQTLRVEATKLQEIPGAHLKFALFFNCFQRKINFFCRTISPVIIKPFLIEFESIKRSLLHNILGVPSLPDYAWDLAQLDLSNGGLGLTDTTLICEAAYFASQLAVESFVRRNARVAPDVLENSAWFTNMAALKVVFPSHTAAIQQGPKGLQSRLCKDLYKTRADLVHAAFHGDHVRFSDKDRATLLSMRHPSTSKWVTSHPTRDLKMNNAEIQIALQARLLLPHPAIQPGSHCPDCSDHPFIGEKGDQHVMGACPSGSSRRVLHDVIAKELTTLAASASFIAHQEPNGCFAVLPDPVRDAGKRPDVRIMSDPRLPDPLRDLLLDVTVTRPTTTTSLQHHSDTVAGAALACAESNKKSKFQQVAAANNHNFVPIAFEGPSGRMADAAKDTVTSLIKAAAEKKGINYSAMSSLWLRRLSVKFQIYNARIYIEKVSAIAAGRNRRHGVALIDESELIYENVVFIHGVERGAESGGA
jgi:hypothetical protein